MENILAAYCNRYFTEPTSLPCEVTLTRVAPRELDDDNLRTAFKSTRDYIANRIIPGLAKGRADGDKRITWNYNQRKGEVREYAIEIDIT